MGFLRSILCITLSFTLLRSVAQESPTKVSPSTETLQQKEKRMEWWRQSRFGMFIHWGLYSVAARHEWVKSREKMSNADYDKYFTAFSPDLYDPRDWAKMAKDAGMKYVVITTKHHEGFCLWDSQFTDYTVVKSPAGKDLLRSMVDAFREQGIRIGFYYSLIDWHHPDFTIDKMHPLRDDKTALAENGKRDMNKYRQYMRDQLTELLTQYGPVDLLFLDYSYPGANGKGREDWQSEELLKLVRRLQPQVIVNDRLDLNDIDSGWDFKTPEQFMPAAWPEVNGVNVPWETCQTFSGSWGYFRDEYSWKSPRQLIAMLAETVSKGGNLLLNVGPTARGMFDDRIVSRLPAIGNWMRYNNRSVYGCTQAPRTLKKPDNCFLTYNEATKRLYVHVLEWPFKSLRLAGYKGKVNYAQLLGDGSEIVFREGSKTGSHTTETTGDDDVLLELPVQKPIDEIPVIEIFLK